MLPSRAEYLKKRYATPAAKYSAQKANAKFRKIEWNLTFTEWWGVWEPHWDERGNKGGAWLCRVVEPGPYSKENVYIGTAKTNSQDRRRREKDATNNCE